MGLAVPFLNAREYHDVFLPSTSKGDCCFTVLVVSKTNLRPVEIDSSGCEPADPEIRLWPARSSLRRFAPSFFPLCKTKGDGREGAMGLLSDSKNLSVCLFHQ